MGASRTFRLLVESLLGDTEGIDSRRHTAVEHHLGNDFRDFFFRNPDMKSARDVALNHLRTVAQHHQRGYGAKAAGFEVNGGPVVYLAIDHRIHQPHHVGGELGHGRRGLRVVLRPVVAHTELGRGLFQVNGLYLVVFIILILIVRRVLQVRLVRTQVRVLVVKVGGHWNALTLTLSLWERGFWESYRICQ